jgi:alcohol dehydrogenase class IV
MWYFTSPQIVFGESALDALDDLKGHRALVVTDANLVELGLVSLVTAHLDKAGIAHAVFDRVEPDPSLDAVRAGARVALDYEPDWIVGLGGGSAMDAAKAIWVLYERPDLDPAEINPIIELGLRKKARLVTIPTTSGTGSEVTWAIVLSDTEAGRKLGLGNRENVADIAIVDPALAAGMPRQLTIDTGLDALTHAIEGYTCAWHTDMTDGICLHAIEMIYDALPKAVADEGDLQVRERMHNAATLAGLGFGNSMASMAHAMGHALGARFHVPHGRAVSLMLPYTIEFIAAEAPERFAEIAGRMGVADVPRRATDRNGVEQADRNLRDDSIAAARALADQFRAFLQDLGQTTSVAGLGVSWHDYEVSLESLVDNAFNDTSILTAARPPTYDELRALFECAYLAKTVDF